jgi:hypothetical protein
VAWQQAPLACMTLRYPKKLVKYRPHRPQELDGG